MVGCLTAETSRIGALNLDVERLFPLTVEVAGMGSIIPKAERVQPLALTAVRRDTLNVRTSLICTVSGAYYLYVTPKETQWVTEWESAVYGIQSNTDWNVE